MNILLVSTAYWPHPCGGSEHVYYLSRGLKSRGHKVTILTTNYSKYGECCELPDIKVIRVGRALMLQINKGTSPFSWGFFVPYEVKKILRAGQYDIVHLHSCYPLELGFWALIFSQSINVLTPHTVGFRRSPIYSLGARLFRKYAKKIHGHIYVSNLARIWNAPYYPGDFRIIPNGVDTVRFSPQVPPFPRPQDRFIILYLGRLDHKKGIMVLLEAVKKLKPQHPEILVYIIGKGPLRKAAQQYLDKNNLSETCHFLGYVARDDIPRYYRTADLYVAPTLGAEALGIVLLEALASGTPTIASKIGGYDEVICDSENGLFFKPGCADDLAAKISAVIT
ncbi:MAG: glycosyltransferase family 4 protein, partial [candidate division WOR-3 bacterium]|nr:glycosyltransferase family 4 protein [candidate division WOR-3 bacterium]